MIGSIRQQGRQERGWAALLACALLACSCATFQQLRFEKPALELEALEIASFGLSDVSLVLWLDVYNPNDYEIRTTRVEVALDLEETHFGSALLEQSVRLPAASHTSVRVPAKFTWEGVGAGARALLERGAVTYSLETKLRVDTSVGGRTLSFRNRGEVPISDRGP
ncbi:MAG: LEA type 2 family protein [Gemmatimonadota bacterium]|nr:MAG: LEA type 2 family protein [Gemmatimonadota bacterium]